jgi:hypothetical protein
MLSRINLNSEREDNKIDVGGHSSMSGISIITPSLNQGDYLKQCDKSISFDDPELDVDWKLDYSKLKFAERDKLLLKLNETKDLFEYIDHLND